MYLMYIFSVLRLREVKFHLLSNAHECPLQLHLT